MSDELSEEEIKKVAESLAKLEPGFLPKKIFDEVTRLTTTPIIEVVPLRQKGGEIEVLLSRRQADDPVWPNMLHTPGTVLRATDSLDSALERIIKKELDGVSISTPRFVKNVLHHSGRGLEASQIYWAEVLGEASIGKFYRADSLPPQLVQSQLDFIPLAIKDFESSSLSL